MRCPEKACARPEGAVCSYSGYLSVPTLTPSAAERVLAAALASGLEIDIESGSIEFEYEGRDSNCFVVRFLQEVALLIGTASGEIRCEIAADDRDPCFEFYRISGGRLFRQIGAIVRQPEQDVRLEN